MRGSGHIISGKRTFSPIFTTYGLSVHSRWVLFIACSFQLSAGTEADLVVELEFNEVGGVVYEPVGTFVVRVTNLSPNIAADGVSGTPLALLSSVIQDNGSFTPEIHFFPGPLNNPACIFLFGIGSPIPGGNVTYGYTHCSAITCSKWDYRVSRSFY